MNGFTPISLVDGFSLAVDGFFVRAWSGGRAVIDGGTVFGCVDRATAVTMDGDRFTLRAGSWFVAPDGVEVVEGIEVAEGVAARAEDGELSARRRHRRARATGPRSWTVGAFVDVGYAINSNFPGNHVSRGAVLTPRAGEFSLAAVGLPVASRPARVN